MSAIWGLHIHLALNCCLNTNAQSSLYPDSSSSSSRGCWSVPKPVERHLFSMSQVSIMVLVLSALLHFSFFLFPNPFSDSGSLLFFSARWIPGGCSPDQPWAGPSAAHLFPCFLSSAVWIYGLIIPLIHCQMIELRLDLPTWTGHVLWILDSVFGFPSKGQRLIPTDTYLPAHSPLHTHTLSHTFWVVSPRKVSFFKSQLVCNKHP